MRSRRGRGSLALTLPRPLPILLPLRARGNSSPCVPKHLYASSDGVEERDAESQIRREAHAPEREAARDQPRQPRETSHGYQEAARRLRGGRRGGLEGASARNHFAHRQGRAEGRAPPQRGGALQVAPDGEGQPVGQVETAKHFDKSEADQVILIRLAFCLQKGAG